MSNKRTATRARAVVNATALKQQVTLLHACIGAGLVTGMKNDVGALVTSLVKAGLSNSRAAKLTACAVDPRAQVLVKGATSIETMLTALKRIKVTTVSALNRARLMASEITKSEEIADDHDNVSYPRELATKIDDLFLSVRAHNVLKNADVQYLGDLVQLTEGQLLGFQNAGLKTVNELREKLAELGLGFGMVLTDLDRLKVSTPAVASNTLAKKPTLADLDANTRTKLYLRVDEIDWSVRALNVLKNASIHYFGDLVQLTESEFLRFPNCGLKTVNELREKLAELGLGFGMVLTDWHLASSIASDALPKKPTLADLDANTRTKLYLRIDEIGLSARAQHVLKNADVEFVGDLIGKAESDMRAWSSCGRQTRFEIKSKLEKLGFQPWFTVLDWSTKAAQQIRKKLDSDSNSPIINIRRGLNAICQSAFLEDELRNIVTSVADERDTDIVLKQLGWSGNGQRTLESVGQEYSITRERVRQIVDRKIYKIRNNYFDLPRLDKALSIVSDRCPATDADLAAELRTRGVSKSDFDPTGLKTACDVFELDFGRKRFYVGSTRVYATSKQHEWIVEILKLSRKLTSSQGCVNFEAMCDELRIPESQRQPLRELVTIDSLCEWLEPDRRWLFSTGMPRNRLSNLVAKVLSVAPHVYLSELRKAVARSRRLAVVPPVAVLAKFVERFELASVSDGRASAISDFADAIRPGSGESILISVLRTHGPILGWDRFQELCMAAGMNPITIGIYAFGSPVVARVTRGIYSLVGADIPPGAVEDLEREVTASRKTVERG